MVMEMVEFIQPETRVARAQKRRAEGRIKAFPHRIVRRDTVTYFFETAYAMAYYEFCKKNYKKGLALCKEFDEDLSYDFLSSLTKYPAVTGTTSITLTKKGKIKSKKDKNSWSIPLPVTTDTAVWNTRSPAQFVDALLDEIPMDLAYSSYHRLLAFYHANGGKLEWLNTYGRPSFFQRCKEAGREDVLHLIYRIWNVSEKDFEVKEKEGMNFTYRPISIDSRTLEGLHELLKSLDIGYNEAKADSLIAINQDPSPHVLSLLRLCYHQNRYRQLVDYGMTYAPYIKGKKAKVTFHDYWALACSRLGDYEEAVRHYDFALAMTDLAATRSTVSLNKAATLGEMGRTEEAVEIFRREWQNQKTPFEKFVWHDNLGYVYSFTDPAKALEHYEEAERYLDQGTLFDERKTRHFCRKAQMLSSNAYLRRQAIERALDYGRVRMGNKVAKGMGYVELGIFNHDAFNHEEAESNFQMAAACYEWLAPEDTRMYRLNLYRSRNLCALGRHDEAAGILSRQLAVQDSVFGKSNLESVRTLGALISAKAGAGDFKGLADLYQRYLLISETQSGAVSAYDDLITKTAYHIAAGEPHRALAILKEGMQGHLTALERIDLSCRLESIGRQTLDGAEYSALCQEIITPLKRQVVETLLLLTDAERKALQRPVQTLMDGFVAGGEVESALALNLFRKGLLLATRQSLEKEFASRRSTRKSYRQLKWLRKDLNHAVAYSDTANIPKLRTSISKLERDLCARISHDKKLRAEIDRNLSQVVQALGPDDVAIDFVRYHDGTAPSYGAFVITPTGNPILVSLGSETELLREPVKVWSPLIPHLNKAGDVYFCPDGALSGLGLEFLAAEGAEMMEGYRLHRAFHLADIMPSRKIDGRVVAVGVADHNSPVGEGDTISRGRWVDLPNVKYELEDIASHLPFASGILFDDEALEENVKSLDGNPINVLHFSTHGFFRSEKALEEAAGDPSSFDYNIARRTLSSGRNSLSGLVLRRGNLSWRAERILDDEDDILTAEEIEGLVFPDLQLTVLSACETALGNVDSEGVWGLQRAFRMAGSRSVLCTLAKVGDRETSLFMEALYAGLADGMTVYDAFRQARKALMAAYPDEPRAWSSYVLIE